MLDLLNLASNNTNETRFFSLGYYTSLGQRILEEDPNLLSDFCLPEMESGNPEGS